MSCEIRKIKQIIPPSGDWFAVYFAGPNGELRAERLVCWALVEDKNGDARVVGMNREARISTPVNNFADNDQISLSEDNLNFAGYAGGGGDISELSYGMTDWFVKKRAAAETTKMKETELI